MIAAFARLLGSARAPSKHFGHPCNYGLNLRQDEVKRSGRSVRIFHDLSAEAEGAAAHQSARVEDSQERAE